MTSRIIFQAFSATMYTYVLHIIFNLEREKIMYCIVHKVFYSLSQYLK